MSDDSARQVWAEVDDWAAQALLPADPVLEATLEASTAAGLPAIAVSPLQGAFLQVLARTVDARLVVEVGTLGGYSTTWLARGVAGDGRVVTIEYSPRHADVARVNLARAGLLEKVDVRLGDATEALPALADELGDERADLVFLDADKANLPTYVEWAIRLVRRGGLVVVDNVVRGGGVVDPSRDDADVQGVRAMLEALRDEPRLDATVLQTVGAKGYDGVLVGIRTDVRDPD
ncbi:O-methyltransferase family 3 [Beutenbergia cavernae DSM 12333]|uniref:O-methyltransferase family 3 n=1 Tax=Beutenbergia cavernae (strain ATCC BAA-8 / DSM 12333 / CCUG 43141 / JCM 11478 / NBRC 16432 / NCIMB 13614 / HKI 0122) TaxID=471853 RepID=C5BV31_BEUC1|nr:O-methyltransferase [Beutenbergia cavernae]ACQ80418.1 O-methyltransferase family 3 [Beutenbergia cavernae DSM 12333]